MHLHFHEFVYACLNDIGTVLCKNLDRLTLNENGWPEMCIILPLK